MISPVFYLEAKLLIRNKFKLLLLVSLILLLIVGFFQTVNEQANLLEKDTKKMTAIYHAAVDRQNNFIEDGEVDVTIVEQNQVTLNRLVSLEGTLFQYQMLIEEERLIDGVSLRIEILELIKLLSKEDGIEFMEKSEVQEQLVYYQSLEKLNLAPSFNNEGVTGMLYLMTVTKVFFSYLGMIFILLFSFDIWNKEGETNYNLLFTQPTSRKKLLLSKFVFQLLFLILIYLILASFSILIGLVMFGLGNVSYPIIVSSGETPIAVPLISFWIQTVILGFLSMAFIVALICMIDSFFKTSPAIFSMMLLIFVIGVGLDKLVDAKNYFPINLFQSWKFILANGTFGMNHSYILAIFFLILLIPQVLRVATSFKSSLQ